MDEVTDVESIKFKGKIWWVGKSWVVTIPRAFVDSELIKKDEEIEFTFQMPVFMNLVKGLKIPSAIAE
ncbi:MAG: hypothetical protein EHM12_10950 [Dehalococcoidia bacterium]|nr:MAG: hypothetical protein EHM12_10950 [Dehalococcoidia bacterium]